MFTLCGIWQGIWKCEDVVSCFACELCGKTRAIHSVDSSATKLAQLKQYLEMQPPRCGETLIIHDIPLRYTFFASAMTTCATKMHSSTFYGVDQETATLGYELSICLPWWLR